MTLQGNYRTLFCIKFDSSNDPKKTVVPYYVWYIHLLLLNDIIFVWLQNPLHLQRNQGYVHPQGSPGTSEFSRPYTADGSVNG